MTQPEKTDLAVLRAFVPSRGSNEEEPRMVPPQLARLVPIGHHDELADRASRWAARGIPVDAIASQVERIARLNPVPARQRARWATERRRLRSVRGRLVTALKQTCAIYDADPERTEVVRSPLEARARAILQASVSAAETGCGG